MYTCFYLLSEVKTWLELKAPSWAMWKKPQEYRDDEKTTYKEVESFMSPALLIFGLCLHGEDTQLHSIEVTVILVFLSEPVRSSANKKIIQS